MVLAEVLQRLAEPGEVGELPALNGLTDLEVDPGVLLLDARAAGALLGAGPLGPLRLLGRRAPLRGRLVPRLRRVLVPVQRSASALILSRVWLMPCTSSSVKLSTPPKATLVNRTERSEMPCGASRREVRRVRPPPRSSSS